MHIMCVHSFCSHGDGNHLNSLIKEQEALLSVTRCGSTVFVRFECDSDGLCLCSNVSADLEIAVMNYGHKFAIVICIKSACRD